MSSTFFGQLVINASVSGLIYALIALGITLVFSIMGILNFAHGAIYMLGAFVAYTVCVTLGQSYFLALFLAILLIGLLGIALEKVLFRPLRGDGLRCMVVSIGLMLFIEGGALLIFGPQTKGVPEVFPGSLNMAGLFLPRQRIFVIALSVVLIAGLGYFIKYVKHGQAMRAICQDRQAALLQGISVDRISWIGFAVGAALAAAAGALLVPLFHVNPYIGGTALLKALIAMIIGGLGSITGAVVGGLLLGIIESIGYAFVPGGWTTLISFLIIVIFLLFRPRGVMGRELKI